MIKEFIPFNKRILLEDVSIEEKTDEGVILPEEYKKSKKSQERFKCYKIVNNSIDCIPNLKEKKGRLVIVEESMVEEIVFEGKKYKLIQENYIIGMFI